MSGQPITKPSSDGLPTDGQLARAIEVYLAVAYEDAVPEDVRELLPPGGSSPSGFLMSERVERTPPEASLDAVRSFAMRLGNKYYRNMKLRLSRPPGDPRLLLSVDSHDAFLHAEPGSPDHEALEELKRRNAAIAASISARWEQAGLLTEKVFLRGKIDQARRDGDPGGT